MLALHLQTAHSLDWAMPCPPAKGTHVCCSDILVPCHPPRSARCAVWLTQSMLPCTGRRTLLSHMGTSHRWQWHGPIGSWGWHHASCRQLVRAFLDRVILFFAATATSWTLGCSSAAGLDPVLCSSTHQGRLFLQMVPWKTFLGLSMCHCMCASPTMPPTISTRRLWGISEFESLVQLSIMYCSLTSMYANAGLVGCCLVGCCLSADLWSCAAG